MGPRNSDTRAGFGTDHTMLCYDTLALPQLETFEFDLHLKMFGPLGLTSKLSDGLSLHSGCVLERHGEHSGVRH